MSALLVARISGAGSALSDLGRQEALKGGWYWSRRPLQALAVAVLGVASTLVAVALLRRAAGRAAQYLPAALCVLALVAFALTRLVSLHQVDTLLYRRPIVGVKIASIAELFCTLLLAVLASRAVGVGDSVDEVGRSVQTRFTAS